MYTTPEQFIAATRTGLEAQFAALTAFNKKAFESVEQIVSLNVSAAKASFEESTAAVQELINAKDTQEFITLSTAQAKPNAEKALAYGRHLASIASAAQQELSKTLEAQIAETNAKVMTFVDEVSKNAPAGSEQAVAVLKTAIGNINAGYDQLTKTSKQAAQTLEENLANATKQFTQTVEKTAKKK